MNNSIACDVVILPNPLLADVAIAASQKLQQFDSLFVLEEGTCFPHASLYMLQLKIDDLPVVEEALSKIARVTTPPQLQAHRYDHTRGFIDAEYEKSPELVCLQRDVIKLLNPIRDGMRKKDMGRMKEAEGLALENFQNYGYKAVGELFRPHMTFARLKSNNLQALKVLGTLSDFNGPFMQLGLFEMGDNGTCIRKIKTFDFL